MITATNYNGRLHLGYGEENAIPQSLGKSINNYRNFISKFVTKFFGFSIKVPLDGKYYCVNKKSFQKHFESIGLKVEDFQKDFQEINKIGYHEFIRRKGNSVILNKNKMHDYLSDEKRFKLFEKMVVQANKNNTSAVKKLIRKGAYLDKQFFKIDDRFFYSRGEVISFAKYSSKASFSIFSYTPLAFVIDKGNRDLAEFILNLKDNNVYSDRKQKIEYSYEHDSGYNDYGNYPISDTHYFRTTKIEEVVVNNESMIFLKDSTPDYQSSLASSEWCLMNTSWIWDQTIYINLDTRTWRD